MSSKLIHDRSLLWCLATNGAACAIIGLLLTIAGVCITASGVIMSDATATEIATPHWDFQPALKQALVEQSHTAAWGLAVIVIGTVIQVISVIQMEWTAYRRDRLAGK